MMVNERAVFQPLFFFEATSPRAKLVRSLFVSAGMIMISVAAASAMDCSQGGSTQPEMDGCAAQEFRASDAKLNADYEKILGCLKPSQGQEKPLVDAQRAWLRFRDLECTFQGSAREGGSAQPMVVSLCLKAVTDDRIKQLSYYLTCQEGDLSCPIPYCKDRGGAR